METVPPTHIVKARQYTGGSTLTVNREIFVLKIYRVKIFRVKIFSYKELCYEKKLTLHFLHKGPPLDQADRLEV